MTNDGPESVTIWIRELGTERHDEALRRIWERYFPILVQRIQSRYRNLTRGIADGEDVAASVLMDFCQGTKAGDFPDLNGRDDLWKLLQKMIAFKAKNWRRRERAKKRGGDKLLQESELAKINPLCDGYLDKVVGSQPTPEHEAIIREECQRLFDALADEPQRVVALLKLDGHSNQEIARELDCSLRSVERILNTIRVRLDRKGFHEESHRRAQG